MHRRARPSQKPCLKLSRGGRAFERDPFRPDSGSCTESAIVRSSSRTSVGDGVDIAVCGMPANMRTIEEMTTKQRIIEKLDALPAHELETVLDYVQFLMLDPVSKSMLSAPIEDERLSDRERDLIQDAVDNPRPGISDEEFRKELGM